MFFGALNVDERPLAHDERRVQCDKREQHGRHIAGPASLETPHHGKAKLGGKAEPESEGRQQFHAIARVIERVWPPDG